MGNGKSPPISRLRWRRMNCGRPQLPRFPLPLTPQAEKLPRHPSSSEATKRKWSADGRKRMNTHAGSLEAGGCLLVWFEESDEELERKRRELLLRISPGTAQSELVKNLRPCTRTTRSLPPSN
nr:hypothetical protein HmN_000840700 [Hymenolepis microstoma]